MAAAAGRLVAAADAVVGPAPGAAPAVDRRCSSLPRPLRRGRRVVSGAPDRVAQQVVGGVDARHARGQPLLLGRVADGAVGMVLPGELPPAPLELLRGRATGHVQDPVGVAAEGRFGHPPRLPPRDPAPRTWPGRVSWPRCDLPIQPPLEPMLAKPGDGLPDGDGWLFEPKWDGFRAICFRDGDEVLLQSRDLKPLDRYFPELAAPLRERLPERCVLDGEIVIAGPDGLDFEALLLRIHPAASRVAMLAEQSPASFVAWDLLALDDRDLTATPQGERRALLEQALAGSRRRRST